MEIEVAFLGGFLMAWPRFGYEWRGKSFGLIRVRLVHEMIGLVKVCCRTRGRGLVVIILEEVGAWLQFSRNIWTILGRVKGIIRITFISGRDLF